MPGQGINQELCFWSLAMPQNSSSSTAIFSLHNWDIRPARATYIQKAGSHSQHILFAYPENHMIEIKKASARSIKNDKGASNSNYRAYNLVSIRLLLSTILPQMIVDTMNMLPYVAYTLPNSAGCNVGMIPYTKRMMPPKRLVR